MISVLNLQFYVVYECKGTKKISNNLIFSELFLRQEMNLEQASE